MSAPTTGASRRTLDPVTFEVLKNAFATSVNLMSEQILRTCYSFVIYSRDFSSALCDASSSATTCMRATYSPSTTRTRAART